MGTLYNFHCEFCGYYAEVSDGEDCGVAQATTTILCLDCRTLYDVPVSHDAMTRKPELEVPIRCPRSWSHRWRYWRHPGPCPRCAATLERRKETVIWD